jgi:hypothetical protein
LKRRKIALLAALCALLAGCDLMPEEEAPVAAIILCGLTKTTGDGAGEAHIHFRKEMADLWNIDLSQFSTPRDSAFVKDNEEYPGNVYALSLAYMPTNGRTNGTQPYLRYVEDQSGLAEGRLGLPKWFVYPRMRFFKRYHDNSNTMLDLTHPFAASNFISENHPVSADEFSRSKHKNTGRRYGDFTMNDCYNVPFNALLYNQQPTQYVTPYREKVLLVRYLELEDPSGKFHETYDGKRYQLISKPDYVPEMLYRNSPPGQLQLGHSINPGNFEWCTMDGEKFDIDYYIENVSFPKAEEGW